MISDQSNLISKTLGLLLPFVLITGLYTIANGHVSPGGGFQGGALLASVFICKYLIVPIKDLELLKVQSIEKVALLMIMLFAIGFLLTGLNAYSVVLNTYYLYLMNLLIGLKVACGMTIIFYRFVFYEGR